MSLQKNEPSSLSLYDELQPDNQLKEPDAISILSTARILL
jgi:hypothetical protein